MKWNASAYFLLRFCNAKRLNFIAIKRSAEFAETFRCNISVLSVDAALLRHVDELRTALSGSVGKMWKKMWNLLVQYFNTDAYRQKGLLFNIHRALKKYYTKLIDNLVNSQRIFKILSLAHSGKFAIKLSLKVQPHPKREI